MLTAHAAKPPHGWDRVGHTKATRDCARPREGGGSSKPDEARARRQAPHVGSNDTLTD